MNKNTSIITEQSLIRTLNHMADCGYIYALCPTCLIPLEQNELQKEACNICGPFDLDQLKYKFNDSPNC